MTKKKRKKVVPMVPVLISVMNQSANLADVDVARAVLAIGKQLAEASQVWGAMPGIEFVPRGGTPNGIPCRLVDELDVPDAAGYHDEGPDGVPYILVLAVAGWEKTLSHEALELGGDAAANLWAYDNRGRLFARELCDADQDGEYAIDGVVVSNYLYPAFFDPNAQPDERLDRQGRVTRPLSTHARGYQIVWIVDPSKIDDVFGEHGDRAHHLGGGKFIVFGADFPEEKKHGKIAKASRRHARAA